MWKGVTGDGYAHYPLAQWRNGQWADPMLAHAGTEAVRLVPFSSLLLSAESLLAITDGTTWDCPLSVELPSHLTPPPPRGPGGLLGLAGGQKPAPRSGS